MPPIDPASKFLNARPYAVLPASPTLAALYASQSPKHSDWCSKCGSYLLDGTAETRIVRSKGKRPHTRVLRRTCGACGERCDTPIGNAEPDLAVHKKAQVLIPSTPPISQSAPDSSQAKARNKKKSALQILLAQHRDRHASVSKAVEPAGLSAFLDHL